MTQSSSDHNLEANIATRVILNNWKNNIWMNNYVSGDIFLTSPSQSFPAPDNCFRSNEKKTKIALEFKPSLRETKRGILTGLGQSIAYISHKQHSASVLVIPEIIQGFSIANFIKSIFEELILNKYPIALFVFKNNDPSNLYLYCNIGDQLDPANDNIMQLSANKYNRTYWAAWREDYPSFNYNLAKLASKEQSIGIGRTDTIWKKFYNQFYCYPPITVSTIELIENKLTTWDKKSIWSESKKKSYKKMLAKNEIRLEDALNRLKWDAASSQKEMDIIWDKLPPILRGNDKKSNDYIAQKKNKRNFMTHCGLWDNDTWTLTERGKKFIERIDNGNNDLEEFAAIILGAGKYNELINDIKSLQSEIRTNDLDLYLNDLKQQFIKNGYIGTNPKRAQSNSRKFLQSERQIFMRFNICKVSKKNSLFHTGKGLIFNEDRIKYLLDIYYTNYANADDLAA